MLKSKVNNSKIKSDKRSLLILLSYIKNNFNQDDEDIELAMSYMFKILLELKESIPNSGLANFLRAFYDALSFQYTWRHYSKEQYESVYKIVSSIINSNKKEDIDNSLIKLKDLGFN